MKILFAVLALFVSVAYANPEISVNANSSFCHWPQDANNGNNETFQGSCTGSVTQNADGTGDGAVRMVVSYPWSGSPYSVTTHFDNQTAPNLQCELDDTNGTAYVSNDWGFAAYPNAVISKKKMKKFQDHFFESDPSGKYDLNGDGIVNYADLALFTQMHGRVDVTYVLTCRDAAQQ